jgi:hypothetical protein
MLAFINTTVQLEMALREETHGRRTTKTLLPTEHYKGCKERTGDKQIRPHAADHYAANPRDVQTMLSVEEDHIHPKRLICIAEERALLPQSVTSFQLASLGLLGHIRVMSRIHGARLSERQRLFHVTRGSPEAFSSCRKCLCDSDISLIRSGWELLLTVFVID